jgi:hypothetical protein
LKLNAKQRRALSSNEFAIPPQGARRGRYPIPDQAHAIAALARVDADGTAEEKRKVRAAIRKRYPDLPSSQGDPHSDAGRSNGRSDPRQVDVRSDPRQADGRQTDARSDARQTDASLGASHADAR